MDSYKEYDRVAIRKKVGEMAMREPKRENQFIVRFPEKFNIDPFTVTKINRPKIVNNKWLPIEIEFTDYIGPSVASSIFFNMIHPRTLNDYGSNVDYLFEIILDGLDPNNVVVERWQIYVKSFDVDFGEFDYSSNKIVKPKVTIHPSYCMYIF